jgi:hypothetical protein
VAVFADSICQPIVNALPPNEEIPVQDLDRSGNLGNQLLFRNNEPTLEIVVEWTPPEGPHSVENLDNLPLKLIRIENKGATNQSQETCPWPENLDAAKAASETHKVIFENGHARVLEVTIPPHSKEPVHTHCLPSTLYIKQIGDIIVRDPDGKLIFDSRQMKENEKQKAPFVLWSPGEGPHSDENPDDVPIKIIQIENKD